MSAPAEIGGAPVLELRAQDPPAEGPAFLAVQVLPGRGMMLLQARLRLSSGAVVDGLHEPDVRAAAEALCGGPDDFNGNASFAFGGAILLPYANRIRGTRIAGARAIETAIDGRTVRLPRNWGTAPGRDDYAMHGLILDRVFAFEQPSPDTAVGRLAAGDFGWGWPGSAEIEVVWSLAGGRLSLTVEVANRGREPLPVGIGWHPYFALPSGERGAARLRLPAAERAEVDNYDDVLPTGRLLPTAGTAYDLSAPDGVALGDRYLDDCFTGLPREDGAAEAKILDPAAGLGLRIASPSPAVKAIQVYAPADQAFVVVEPQFNLADPYGACWPPGLDTGMARVTPGGRIAYRAEVEAFALRDS